LRLHPPQPTLLPSRPQSVPCLEGGADGTSRVPARFPGNAPRALAVTLGAMPAITVDDITRLERLPEPDPTGTPRRVRSVTTAPSGLEGEGFPVRRAFQGVDLADLD